MGFRLVRVPRDRHRREAARWFADVAAHLSPPAPPEALSFTEPRAVLRALNFLDVTYELVFGEALVVPPPMDRSSLLALDVDDEAADNSGLVVLTDILRDFKVPGRNPGSGLLRLEEHLADKLPALDRDAVHQAVQLLDQIRVIRNSAVHPKPRPELAVAHHALGLRFPVRDTLATAALEKGENALIVAAAVGIGLIPIAAPDFYHAFPKDALVVLDSGISTGCVVAIALNLAFNHLGRKPDPSPQEQSPAAAAPVGAH